VAHAQRDLVDSTSNGEVMSGAMERQPARSVPPSLDVDGSPVDRLIADPNRFQDSFLRRKAGRKVGGRVTRGKAVFDLARRKDAFEISTAERADRRSDLCDLDEIGSDGELADGAGGAAAVCGGVVYGKAE
jgi:hypothetical protein